MMQYIIMFFVQRLATLKQTKNYSFKHHEPISHSFIYMYKLGYHAVTVCSATYVMIELKPYKLYAKLISSSSYISISRIRNRLYIKWTSQFTEMSSKNSCSGSEWSQPQLYVVCEPNGLGSGFGSLFARPDGSRKVAEVVSDLKWNHDIRVLFFLRDHFDEETNLVGFPKGDNTVEKTRLEIGLRLTSHC